jgi:glycosyltransferase involved in cell wall biosynthesis
MTSLSKLPEVVGRIEIFNRRPRLMTPVWGSLRSSFSGSTWFCSQAAIKETVLDAAFVLESRRNLRLQASGALWKLRCFLREKKVGGYKFAQAFSDVLWSQYLPILQNTVIISNLQVLGKYFLCNHARLNVTPCFYIDGTLTEYFYEYGAVQKLTMSSDTVGSAIEMERQAYQHSAHIFTMSRSTGRSLVEVYGVPRDRISLLLPGANFEDEDIPKPSIHRGWVGSEFTLGFIGLAPFRKGLDKLAGAVRVLRDRKIPIRLRVIGRCPDEIAAIDGIDFLGAIDKATHQEAFIAAIRTVDLGCQLSRAELLGIAMLEFLRVGVPVMATEVGGMPDVLREGGGVLVPPEITVEQLAEELYMLMSDSSRYQALRQAAICRADWASWRRTAREMGRILDDLSQ